MKGCERKKEMDGLCAYMEEEERDKGSNIVIEKEERIKKRNNKRKKRSTMRSHRNRLAFELLLRTCKRKGKERQRKERRARLVSIESNMPDNIYKYVYQRRRRKGPEGSLEWETYERGRTGSPD